MSSFIILSAIILLVIFVSFHWSRRNLYKIALRLPGPFAFPFVGSGWKFLFCKKENVLKTIKSLTDGFPSPMKVWVGPKLVILVKDPTQLQAIMQSSKMSKKSYIYDFMIPFMGKALFTTSGLAHKNHRKLLQPLFYPKFVESYCPLFHKHANNLLDRIKTHDGGEEFDILFYLHDLANDSAIDILFGEGDDLSPDFKQLPEHVRYFYDVIAKRTLNFWLHFDCIYNWTNYYKKQEKMRKFASRLTKEVIDLRVPKIRNRFNSNSQNSNDIPTILEMMMQLTIDNPQCLTDQEFIDHMITFFATSQDTQSSAMAFTLMMLAMHPQHQNLVYEEIQKILEEGNKSTISYEDLNDLKYLEMCIKESLRLFPLAPYLFRDVEEDFNLLDKWIIPKGANLVLGVYDVHTDAKFWRKPKEFFPNHFEEQEVTKRHPYAFLPFSSGPRRCIAQQYSYANMKIVISSVLLKFSLYSDQKLDNLKITTDVSIRPVDGYKIKIKSRL